MRRFACLLAFCSIRALADQSAPPAASAKAPVAAKGDGCEAWEGVFTDDYPGSAATALVLHRNGDRVVGTLGFDGVHGRDQRQVVGEWHGSALHMRDLRFVDYHPKPGLTLCLCLKYDLFLDGNGHLVGSCVTDPVTCGDHGHLDLRRSDKIPSCSIPTASPSTKKPRTKSGSGSD